MSTDGRAGGLTASLPQTPHHRHGAVIDQVIASLDAKWHLGLRTRSRWSLKQTKSSDHADKIYDWIQQLQSSAKPDLDHAITIFEQLAPVWPPEDHLQLLHRALLSKVKNHKPDQSQKATQERCPASKKMDGAVKSQSSFKNGAGLVGTYAHTVNLDPGSPTDVESEDNESDEQWVTPPSPSPASSARLAYRQFQEQSPLHSRTARKRKSDSAERSGDSPKMMKMQNSQPLPFFKKPSIDMALSFRGITSFISTNTSSNRSTFSSQEGDATANTSFTSMDGALVASRPSWAEIDPAKTSLSNHAYLHVTGPLPFQEGDRPVQVEPIEQPSRLDQNEEHSSTYGSVNDDDIRHASETIGDSFLGQHNQNGHEYNQDPLHQHGEQVGLSLTASFPPARPSRGPHSVHGPCLRTRSVSMFPSLGKERMQARTPEDSLSREAHYTRDLPKHNLFVDSLPSSLTSLPYFLLFICQRIACEASITMTQLFKDVGSPLLPPHYDAFWLSIRNHPNPKVSRHKYQENTRIWQTSGRGHEGYTFKGRLSFNSKGSKQIFSFQPLPIQAGTICRFQRKFGSDRYIYLDVPSFRTDKYTKDEKIQIETRWYEWLGTEHEFLGRTWRVFDLGYLKRKGRAKNKDLTHDKRIVLFATRGPGLEAYSIGAMLNWFLPFARNPGQTWCKAFARFDLGLSRTTPTVIFKPSQVRYEHDIIANDEAESKTFDDSSLRWEPIPIKQVMNDGCSMISVGAAKEVWRLYTEAMGLDSRLPCPSVFQGRIGGAKGLWMISADSSSHDPCDTSKWIQITESQLKFDPHVEDLDEEKYDPVRLTFEVTNYSSFPSASELHISFIPIMVDRGVPEATIADYVTECLTYDDKQLFAVLENPRKLYEWLHRNGSKRRDEREIAWQGSLPVLREERLRFLLESGFNPVELPFLAEQVKQFLVARQLLQESNLRTPLGKSLYIYGVADPFGVLEPGEIHIQFSSTFSDEMTGNSYRHLRDLELLVARHPACRRSDIQKVRAVVHPRLDQITDVVVFPSRGQYPLAGKLQGGDYDGDIFWLCWESKLVAPFKNAPAPVHSLEPTQYGIRVEKEKVKDVMNIAELDVDRLLDKALRFTSNVSLLGRATVLLEAQAYRENKVFSPTLNKLYDLHDLLVDAPKQGYVFTESDFSKFRKNILRLDKEPSKPAYKDAMEKRAQAKEKDTVNTIKKTTYRFSSERVLDSLLFDVVIKHHAKTMEEVDRLLAPQSLPLDETLLSGCTFSPFCKNDEDKEIVVHVMLKLESALKQLYLLNWAPRFRDNATAEQKNAAAEACYQRFCEIQPIHAHHEIVRRWLDTKLGVDTNQWTSIRASMLYKLYGSKHAAFVFKMAGVTLANIKGRSVHRTRSIVAAIYGTLRPKRIKAPVEYEEEDDASDDDGKVQLDVLGGRVIF